MIEYVEIRSGERVILGIIDTAISIIWHSVYYGVGDFEIYAKAIPEHLDLLQKRRYVTRPDNDEIGIIEKIEISTTDQDGTVITASGRFAKSLLDRRLIYNLSGNSNKATTLRGNVESAARALVANNMISCTFDTRRNVPFFKLGTHSGSTAVIVDENGNAAQKQVSYQNLLSYTDGLLQEYNFGSIVKLNDTTKDLEYFIFAGEDRSIDNTDENEAIIFSRDYDNLTESNYYFDEAAEKNVALIGGAGEDINRFYYLLAGSASSIYRREAWVDASSQNKTMKSSELLEMFPTGTFVGTTFVVGGVVYADLETDLEKEYTLANLQEKFPSGTVSGQKFVVGGVDYAVLIYGETTKYNLTPLGYKAMLDVEETDGDYTLRNAIYSMILATMGKQSLATQKAIEKFSGSINVTFGTWKLNEDYFLGDVVTIQDNAIDKYADVRILEITEIQDANGYTVEATYE